MADYGHDLQFGFFLDPSIGNPGRTLEVAQIVDELGLDLIGIQDHPYNARHFDALAQHHQEQDQRHEKEEAPDERRLDDLPDDFHAAIISPAASRARPGW